MEIALAAILGFVIVIALGVIVAIAILMRHIRPLGWMSLIGIAWLLSHL